MGKALQHASFSRGDQPAQAYPVNFVQWRMSESGRLNGSGFSCTC